MYQLIKPDNVVENTGKNSCQISTETFSWDKK